VGTEGARSSAYLRYFVNSDKGSLDAGPDVAATGVRETVVATNDPRREDPDFDDTDDTPTSPETPIARRP
jgi:hypothetical protein